MPTLYSENQMYPTACWWAHLQVCGRTAHVAEWKANFEDLTMEICCWMPINLKVVVRPHPWSQECDPGVELKVVFGEGRLLTSGINSAYHSCQLGDSWPPSHDPSDLNWEPAVWYSLSRLVQMDYKSQRNYCSDTLYIIQVFTKVLRIKNYKQ